MSQTHLTALHVYDPARYTSVFLEVDKAYDSAQQPHWQCFVHFKLDILSSKIRYTYEKKVRPQPPFS